MADLTLDLQVSRHQRICDVVVPLVARDFLEVPGIFAARSMNRDDRRYKKVVAAAGTTDVLAPGKPVSSAKIYKVSLGIIEDGVPSRGAAAIFPEISMPGLCRLLEQWRIGRVARRGWNRIETPPHLAAGGVIGRDISTAGIFCAGVADHHHAFHDPRRLRNRIGLLGVGR